MVSEKGTCIICRTKVKGIGIKSGKKSLNLTNIFDAWNIECSEAICDVLFGSKSGLLFNYFRNVNYCCSCQQIVRDIGFMWKQIQSFQNRIFQLSTEIRKNLNLNYQLIEEKSKPNVIHDRVSVFLETAESKKIPQYSYNHMVEIIYTAVLRHVLQLQQVDDLSPDELEKQLENSTEDQSKGILVPTKLEIVKQEVEDLNFEDNDWEIDNQPIDSSTDEFNKTAGPSLHRISLRKRKKRIKYENNDDEREDSEVSDSSSITNVERKTRHVKAANSRGRKVGQPRKIVRIKEKCSSETKLDAGNTDSNTRIQCSEETCRATFTTEQKMKLHVLKFHSGDKKPYHCTKCDKKFSTKRALTEHSGSHASEKVKKITMKYPCSFCGKRYVKEEDLTTHYSVAHQEPNPFTCAFCPEVYTNSVDLKQHTREHHRDPYKKPRSKCDVCEKSFSSKYTLKYHMMMHGDQSLLFSCPICEMKFPMKQWLNMHMDKHSETKQYKCDKCDSSFTHACSLRKHKIHHHNEGGYPCTICGTMLTSFKRWETHELSHKKLIVSQKKRSRATARYLHVCKFCGKGYNQEEEIQSHYAVAHLGPNPFTCAFCSNVYSNSIDLLQHMKTYHPDPIAQPKKYPCQSCDKVFITRDGLRNHSIIHKDPSLLYRCHLCPGVFIHNSFLTKHIRRHSEEKKCICDTCGKGFKDMDYLKTHMKCHLEKKFQCKLCERKFTTSQQCKAHEITHTGIKDYVCQACGKAFAQKGNMDSHYKAMHTGERQPKRRRNTQEPSQQDSQPEFFHYDPSLF